MNERQSLTRRLYEQQGFVIFPGGLRGDVKLNCLRLAEEADKHRSWVSGDDSDHAWEELLLTPPFDLSAQLTELNVIDAIGAPVATSQWLNRYSDHQLIPAHVDAAGDAHLLFVLNQDPGPEGGHLWLGSEERVIPLGEGDAVLFPAARIPHGMTPMKSDARRMTFNVRLWTTPSLSHHL